MSDAPCLIVFGGRRVDVLAREYEPWNREHLVLNSSTSSVNENVAAIRRILMLK